MTTTTRQNKRRAAVNRLQNVQGAQLSGDTRRLIGCWAMHEDFLDRLAGALGSDALMARFEQAADLFDETMKALVAESVMATAMESDFMEL